MPQRGSHPLLRRVQSLSGLSYGMAPCTVPNVPMVLT